MSSERNKKNISVVFFHSRQFHWTSSKPITTLSYIGQGKTGTRSLNFHVFLDLFKKILNKWNFCKRDFRKVPINKTKDCENTDNRLSDVIRSQLESTSCIQTDPCGSDHTHCTLCRWETRLPFALKLLPRVQLLQQSPVKAVPCCQGPGQNPGTATSTPVWWSCTLLQLHRDTHPPHRQVHSGWNLRLLPPTEVINTINSSPSSWFLMLLHFTCNPHLYFCCFSPRVEVPATKFTKEINLMSMQWFSLWSQHTGYLKLRLISQNILILYF